MAVLPAGSRPLFGRPEHLVHGAVPVRHREVGLAVHPGSIRRQYSPVVIQHGGLPVSQSHHAGRRPSDILVVGRKNGPVGDVRNVQAVPTVNEKGKVVARELARTLARASERRQIGAVRIPHADRRPPATGGRRVVAPARILHDSSSRIGPGAIADCIQSDTGRPENETAGRLIGHVLHDPLRPRSSKTRSGPRGQGLPNGSSAASAESPPGDGSQLASARRVNTPATASAFAATPEGAMPLKSSMVLP